MVAKGDCVDGAADRQQKRAPRQVPTRSAIPRWVVLPNSGPTSTDGPASMAGLAAASGLRFPRALSPTLQATLGELSVPAVTMAVHGTRQGGVRYHMRRLHDGRGGAGSADAQSTPVLDRPGAHRETARDAARRDDGDHGDGADTPGGSERPPLRARTRTRDAPADEEPDMNVQ